LRQWFKANRQIENGIILSIRPQFEVTHSGQSVSVRAQAGPAGKIGMEEGSSEDYCVEAHF
jgi:hypothetical protein